MDIKKKEENSMDIHIKEQMKIHKAEHKMAVKDGHFSLLKNRKIKDELRIAKTSSIKLAGSSIKKKNAEQVDGGDELQQASDILSTGAAISYGTGSIAGGRIKKKALDERKRRLKVVQTEKKVAKKTAKTVGKETSKTSVKKTVKSMFL